MRYQFCLRLIRLLLFLFLQKEEEYLGCCSRLRIIRTQKKSNVYKFYRLLEKDVKEVVVESDPPPDADSRCLGSAFFGPHLRPISPKIFSERVISDVVLSSSPMDDDCIAVVTYGRDTEVAFCRIRDDPNCWTLLDSPSTTCGQIVYHSGKKLFYALSDCSSKIEAWDLHNDPIKRFHFEEHQTDVLGGEPFPIYKRDKVKSTLGRRPERKDYLVYDHQSEELFVVTRHAYDEPDLLPNNKTTTFGIFKAVFIDDHLVKLQPLKKNSIGNLAIFLNGGYGGFTLSTTEFPELRPSSIYFADNRPCCYDTDSDWRYQDLVIYDYKEDSIMDKINSISLLRSWLIPDA
ncbi:hypothetical protein FXO38_12106 [Capsicum annuum]|nr:hypothetical protein FXO38_12106 [Capsicum annuum]